MAGIYVHIPFCASRCKYCDFYSTTLLDRREEYVQALLQEIKERCSIIPSEHIATVYIGGGTPSMLTTGQIEQIISAIGVSEDKEVTMEANPQDLSREQLKALREMGINRLSIGIQSFNNGLLQLIGRRHTGITAQQAVREAQAAGFDNISIDLIYGLPTQGMAMWQSDVATALQLGVQHISAYCLSYEDNTTLAHMLQSGKIQAIDDDTENAMYEYLVRTLQANGYEHYEVSNFCLPQYHSRHNSSYWDDTPYIGLGAASHSYNGEQRRWNIADITAYIEGIKAGRPIYEEETLTADNKFNERVMLSLRTAKGLDLQQLSEADAAYCIEQARPWLDKGLLHLIQDRLYASLQGTEILNRIIESFIRI